MPFTMAEMEALLSWKNPWNTINTLLRKCAAKFYKILYWLKIKDLFRASEDTITFIFLFPLHNEQMIIVVGTLWQAQHCTGDRVVSKDTLCYLMLLRCRVSKNLCSLLMSAGLTQQGQLFSLFSPNKPFVDDIFKQ